MLFGYHKFDTEVSIRHDLKSGKFFTVTYLYAPYRSNPELVTFCMKRESVGTLAR